MSGSLAPQVQTSPTPELNPSTFPPPIYSTTFVGPPPLARRTGIRVTDRPRALLGWTHQSDTPAGLLTGKIWTAVSKHGRFNEYSDAIGVRGALQVFYEPFNRTKTPGEVRMCGVANFSMVRMFHPYWDANKMVGVDVGANGALKRIPTDLDHKDKQVCRRLYLELLKRYGPTVGYYVDALEGVDVPGNDGGGGGSRRRGAVEVEDQDDNVTVPSDAENGDGVCGRRSFGHNDDVEDGDCDVRATHGPGLGCPPTNGAYRRGFGRRGHDDHTHIDPSGDDPSSSLLTESGSTSRRSPRSGPSDDAREKFRSMYHARSMSWSRSPSSGPSITRGRRRRRRIPSVPRASASGSHVIIVGAKDKNDCNPDGKRCKRGQTVSERRLVPGSCPRSVLQPNTTFTEETIEAHSDRINRNKNADQDDDPDVLFVRQLLGLLPTSKNISSHVNGPRGRGPQCCLSSEISAEDGTRHLETVTSPSPVSATGLLESRTDSNLYNNFVPESEDSKELNAFTQALNRVANMTRARIVDRVDSDHQAVDEDNHRHNEHADGRVGHHNHSIVRNYQTEDHMSGD